jgi:hypothetical protein
MNHPQVIRHNISRLIISMFCSYCLYLFKGAEHLRNVFYRMGFDDRDIVALSGGHTLGKCEKRIPLLHTHKVKI